MPSPPAFYLVTVNVPALAAVRPGVATPILPVFAPLGTVAVIWVSESTVKLVALLLPKLTLVAPVKLSPVEIIAVLNRPYIRDRSGLGDRIFDVSLILGELAELVIDLPDVTVSSGPDDDKFLATADAGRADYLVPAISVISFGFHKYRNVAIISPREFVLVLTP